MSITEYPIGQQDFKVLREGGYLYIDKTRYLEYFVRPGRYYFLARPRRFGKSLFLSTLQYFFEGRRELFKGLYADTMDWDWLEYPVLRLDLNTERYAGPDMLAGVLSTMFSDWEEKYGVKVIQGAPLSQRLKRIIESAHRTTGRQVVVLIDEYDKPLVSSLGNDASFEHFRSQLSGIYSNFKSCAEHIRLVFITGVSRFSKLSIFSDLNNLNDITLDDDFADVCGITEKEMSENFQDGMARLAGKMKCSVDDARGLLKQNYDGYRFAAEGSEIYNPWSVLNCMGKCKIANYWNHTGIPTLVAEVLKRSNTSLEEIFNTECTLDTLMGLDLQSADPLALLYQTGYLTIKNYDHDVDLFTLGIPNKEVRTGLFDQLVPYYVTTKGDPTEIVVRKLTSSLIAGRPDDFMRNLQIYFAGIPYEMNIESENNFQNCFYILVSLLGFNAKPEVHTSEGRIDLVITTNRYAYIIELKYDSSAQDALRQIEQKRYAMSYADSGKSIFEIGVAFSSKTRNIDGWEIRLYGQMIAGE